MKPTLRDRLRRETGDIHEQVEEAFAHLDLATREGLDATLRAHIRVMERLLPSLENHPEYQREVQRLQDLALRSLAFSDKTTDGEAAANGAPSLTVHPLAATYVIFGSRLGSRVIASNLKRQNVGWPQGAIAYFTDDQTRPLWQKLVQDIKDYDCEGDKIVADAVLTFELFLSEAREASALQQSST